ncbi:hypothetical protein AB0K66_26970 [Streptomyces werraensis]|uniref:hypothetical protein n=1 Tax=Streptomyces werraensis TaxID=68284 RepID=UPI00343C30F8
MSTFISREARLAQLLEEIRAVGGRWTTGRVQRHRRQAGQTPCRTTTRRDLLALTARGHLEQHGPENDQYYTLSTRKDARS